MLEIVLTKEDIIKGEVIDAAQKLFQQYGFKKTTMEDIALSMGRGKSTLYYYYKSKDMIFRDVILKEATEVMTALTEATGNEISSEKKLQTYVITFFDVVKSKVSLYNMMKKELMTDEGIYINKPLLKKSLLQFNAEQFDLVKKILILGVENKEFTSEIKDNIDVYAYILNVGLRSLTFNLAFDAKSGILGFFEDEKLKIMFNILMSGLRSV